MVSLIILLAVSSCLRFGFLSWKREFFITWMKTTVQNNHDYINTIAIRYLHTQIQLSLLFYFFFISWQNLCICLSWYYIFFDLPAGPLSFLLQPIAIAMMTSALHYSTSRTACLLTILHHLILVLTPSLHHGSSTGQGVGATAVCGKHVIELDLSSSFLYGPINSNTTLFTLLYLRRLNLADNDFRFSQIPSGIGRLSQLASLNLSHSFFSGQVPKKISNLTQLVSLDLSGNWLLKLQSFIFRNLVQNTASNLRELFLSEVNIDSQVPRILANSSSLRSLVLRDCGLHGEFPTAIFQLPMLQHLDVQGNRNLNGYLPKFHGNSSQLKHLILAETNFHGKVPASIGHLINLYQLNLSLCNFSGPLPGSVSNLTQLTFLDLSNNRFWGRVPSLASLSKLSHLDLYDNQFDGRNLPDWLGKLPKLTHLTLRANNLSCEIPSSIGNQTQLRELYLSSNRMVGQIPSSIMNLTHLTNLSLGYNYFTGHLPSLESLSNLTYLFLGNNTFDGWKLPDWLGKLNKLTYLDLYGVNLYGEIPSSMGNLTKLTQLELGDNQLKGPIPSSLSNLKNIEMIALNDNNISGTVEANIFLSLKKLEELYLGGNRITLSVINNHTNDTLPKFVSLGLESCNLRVFPDFLRFQDQLHDLSLNNNKLEGLIPAWMGNVSKETLMTLSISQNSLTGFEQRSPVLPWVGLEALDLRHNMLHGSIPVPPPTTMYLLVSNNNLTGEIPPSICDLQSLQLLDLSFNNISGLIPPCLEKLSNSLLVLNLRGNTLRGTTPDMFQNGSKLVMINLSENQLEGQLPRSLENCASLQILDVENNRMEGMFPFWLGALLDLQVLILGSNKFHGAIRNPSKTNSKFRKLRIIDLSYNSFSGDLPLQYFPAMKKTESVATYMETYVDNLLMEGYIWNGNYSFSMKLCN